MVLDTAEKKKISQTMSQTFWEAFGASEIRYRVFYTFVLANARKIVLFLFS